MLKAAESSVSELFWKSLKSTKTNILVKYAKRIYIYAHFVVKKSYKRTLLFPYNGIFCQIADGTEPFSLLFSRDLQKKEEDNIT